MKKYLIYAIVLLIPIAGFSQKEKKKKDFGIKFSGFVKNDFFVDSRQTINAREGHFLLWPSAVDKDVNGIDINDGMNFNFLSIQSRLSGKITGPNALGAKTSGLIEGDFFAQANGNINLFRLRHAFVKMNWENTELLFGQYWNPLFITDCFPGTVSFNSGAPIQPFARNPQIRLTQKFGGLKLMVAAVGQRDHASRGPNGASSEYLRNAGIPDLHAQIHYNYKSKNFSLVTGIGVETKTIKPRLSSTISATVGDSVVKQTFAVNETIRSNAALFFAKITTKPITLRVEAIYGENIADVLSISGYAVQSITDPSTGELTYTPFTNLGLWGDIQTNGKKLQFGCFAGMSQNLGTKEDLSDAKNDVYGLGINIQNLYRVSPRVVYNTGKMRFGLEAEITGVEFPEAGTLKELNGLYKDTYEVYNTRILFSTYYFF